MPTMRDIKRRVKSIKNIQQITRAMMLVAAAKMKKAEIAITSARPYAHAMGDVLSSLALRVEKEQDDPLLLSREVKTSGLLMLTSQRGLCGGFNSNIIKNVFHYLEEERDKAIEMKLMIIGRKGFNFFKRFDYNIPFFLPTPDSITYKFAEELAEKIIDLYESLQIDELIVVYNEFKSVFRQKVVRENLLPIIPISMPTEKMVSEYIYEPSKKELLNVLLKKHIVIQIYRILLESQSSEYAARMVAMESATTNAKKMISQLSLTFNRARQAVITKEISEITGTAEALK
ncbi:MAG: ATP synthase F1 subunit gamma [Nitrospirota bacterium]